MDSRSASLALRRIKQASQGSSGNRVTALPSDAAWATTYRIEGHKALLRRLLDSPAFGYLICGIAILDSVLIGLEQNSRMERGDVSLFSACERGFVVFYLCELILVVYGFGGHSLFSKWFRLDFFLVLAGLGRQFMLATQLDEHFKRWVLLLRLCRMLRLARTYRVLVKFKELWLLAHGFINSLAILLYTLLLGMVILYVYGCVAMELMPLSFMDGEQELSEALQSNMEQNFKSLPVAMLSLLQFATFDSANAIYRPWLEAMPSMALFFISALFVMGVVFMNLVTAVIVNRALDDAMQDQDMQKRTRERERKALLRSLELAFEEADSNCSGALSREELASISKEQKELLAGIVGGSDLLKLFDYLDVDGDGAIAIEEFCVGIEGLVNSDTRLEIKRMERMMDSMRRQLRESVKSMANAMHDTMPDTFEENYRNSEPPLMQRAESQAALQLADNAPLTASFTYSSLQDEDTLPLPAWASDILEELRAMAEKLEEALHPDAQLPANGAPAPAEVMEANEKAPTLPEGVQVEEGSVGPSEEPVSDEEALSAAWQPPGYSVPRSQEPVLLSGGEASRLHL